MTPTRLSWRQSAKSGEERLEGETEIRERKRKRIVEKEDRKTSTRKEKEEKSSIERGWQRRSDDEDEDSNNNNNSSTWTWERESSVFEFCSFLLLHILLFFFLSKNLRVFLFSGREEGVSYFVSLFLSPYSVDRNEEEIFRAQFSVQLSNKWNFNFNGYFFFITLFLLFCN